jgi:ABC-2 type transport system permease protein
MRNIVAIWRREMLSFFVSPVAYFVIAGFGLLSGFFFFNMLAYFNVVLERIARAPWGAPQAPNVNQWVIEQYFQTILILLVFLIPLLTMRVIAEERRRGTFELLVTSPVSVGEIVLGKFLGIASVLVAMIFMASIFPLAVCLILTPEIAPVFCGIGGTLLFALGMASVAMAVSSFTENQIVAAISSVVVLLLLYVIQSPAEALGPSTVASILQYLSPPAQIQDMLRGVVTLKSTVYFLSLISLGLFFSFRALEAHRWR